MSAAGILNMRNNIFFLLLVFLTAFSSGCHTVRVERPVTALDAVEERQPFFLLGLVGENEIDLARQCPRGIASIEEKFTFLDAVFSLASVGIYTPRTVAVRCAA